MPRLLSRAGLLVLPLALATLPARAESVHTVLDGQSLTLQIDSVKSINIQPDPSLKGKVDVEATAHDQGDLEDLKMTGGNVATIVRHYRCMGVCMGHTTLVLSIKVPPGMPIDLTDSGSGDVTIGQVAGPLAAKISGSGDLMVGDARDLQIKLSGSNDLMVDHTEGSADITLSGSGRITMADGHLSGLMLKLSGSGDAVVDIPTVDNLDLIMSGSGDFRGKASFGNANIKVSGSGDVTITKVTGALSQNIHGSGNVRIGH